MRHWWLSFILPGERQLGAAIVAARNFSDAVDEAWRRGCNPGGEVRGWELPEEPRTPDAFVNRLLDPEESEAVNSMMRSKALIAAPENQETPERDK